MRARMISPYSPTPAKHARQRSVSSLLRLTSIAALCLFLTACGWHLRGAQPLPPQLQTIQLGDTYANTEFMTSLRRSLRANQVTVLSKDEPLNQGYRLDILKLNDRRRVASTGSRGKAAEYGLTASVEYRIRDNEGNVVAGPERLSSEKIYLFDRDNVAAAFEEEQLLRKEMHNDLVQQLIRRYRALAQTPESTE